MPRPPAQRSRSRLGRRPRLGRPMLLSTQRGRGPGGSGTGQRPGRCRWRLFAVTGSVVSVLGVRLTSALPRRPCLRIMAVTFPTTSLLATCPCSIVGAARSRSQAPPQERNEVRRRPAATHPQLNPRLTTRHTGDLQPMVDALSGMHGAPSRRPHAGSSSPRQSAARTQNSLPSGSAKTTHDASPWPISTRCAP